MRERRALSCIVVAVLAACGPALAAETYYVRENGNDGASGLTPANAFATLQHAVNQCDGPGHTIYVGPGTYAEEVYVGLGVGAPAQDATAAQPNRILGDPTGAATGDDPGPVLLDGGGFLTFGIYLYRDYWTVSYMTLQGQVYALLAQYGDGTTFTFNTVYAASYYSIYSYGGDGGVVDDNLVVRQPLGGYGILVRSKTGTVSICRNRLNATGVDYLSTPWQNGTSGWMPPGSAVSNTMGLGVYNDLSSAATYTVENNIITDHYFGMYIMTVGSPSIVNVYNNVVAGCRHGFYLFAIMGPVNLYDNIITDTYIGTYGWAYACPVVVDGLLTHGINNIETLLMPSSGGTVNISNVLSEQDPMWVNPTYGNFLPRISSPLVDAGQGSASTSDLLGRPRPLDGDNDTIAVVDIGPYEFSAAPDSPQIVIWQEVDPH